jgi:antitoxin HicB
MRFTVVFEQETDGGYVVSVPALPGCISQGDTHDAALVNIKEAIAAYVEALKKVGEPNSDRCRVRDRRGRSVACMAKPPRDLSRRNLVSVLERFLCSSSARQPHHSPTRLS